MLGVYPFILRALISATVDSHISYIDISKHPHISKNIQLNLSDSNTDGSFTTAVSNSFLSPLETKTITADLGKFRAIFFFILKMVYCVYSLESPQ